MKLVRFDCFCRFVAPGIVAGLAVWLCLIACSGLKKPGIPSARGITDLVLLYHTDSSRPAWTPEQIQPYLYRAGAGGRPEWLFDGLLFVEFIRTKNGKTYTFDLDAYGRIYADRALWEELTGGMLADGRGPDAAEQVLVRLAGQGYEPPYKRQVVFGLPNPAYGMKNWGVLHGKTLDFTDPADRIAAIVWYVDRIVSIWKKKNYRYLDLAGFYWTKELLNDCPDADDRVLTRVKAHLDSLGYSFSWIPYYGADGAADWRAHGFDVAYQQPNHFFSTETPDWFLPESIRYAVTHGLKMEMEFDERVEQPEFAERYYKYIDAFEKAGVWETMPVAYYQGNDAWLRLAQSDKPEMQAMYERMCGILSRRQGKFSVVLNGPAR